MNRDSHILKNIKYIQSGLKIFLLSILSLHGWTYFSPRIFVICHVVKEIQYKNLKNCPYSPQFINGIINKLKTSFPSNVLLNIHSTLILPYLNYGILAWGNSARNQLDKLLITQKRVMRIICNKNRIAHSNQLFYSNQVLNIHDLFHLRLGCLTCFMYQLNQGELPLAISSLFSKNERLHNYPTRQSSFYHFQC